MRVDPHSGHSCETPKAAALCVFSDRFLACASEILPLALRYRGAYDGFIVDCTHTNPKITCFFPFAFFPPSACALEERYPLVNQRLDDSPSPVFGERL
jgi:hypothetical protein